MTTNPRMTIIKGERKPARNHEPTRFTEAQVANARKDMAYHLRIIGARSKALAEAMADKIWHVDNDTWALAAKLEQLNERLAKQLDRRKILKKKEEDHD